MKYLGIDVHVKTSVWCLLDESGQIIERGKVATTALDPTTLLKRLTETDALVAGQDVGKMSYLVHDVCAAGAPNDSRQPGSVHSAVHSSSFDRLPSSHASAWISVKSRVDAVASGMLCR